MRRYLLYLSAMFVLVMGGSAWAVEELDLAAWSSGGGDKEFTINAAAGYEWRIFGSTPMDTGRPAEGGNPEVIENIKRTIYIDGTGAAPGHKFRITLDNIKLVSRPCAIQIYNGADVELYIKGTNEIIVPNYTSNGGVGLIHIGVAENSGTGKGKSTTPTDGLVKGGKENASKLHIIGDSRYTSTLRIDYSFKNNGRSNGADGIRAAGSSGGTDFAYIPNNKLEFKDLNVEIVNIRNSNRGICGDTTEELFFDNCRIYATGGNCISGGLAWDTSAPQDKNIWCDIHFRNCELHLTGDNPDNAAIAVHGNSTRKSSDGRDAKLILCDTEANTALIVGVDKGAASQPAVRAPIIEIVGGAVQVTHQKLDTNGIETNELRFLTEDYVPHPTDGTVSNIMFYVDRIHTVDDPTGGSPIIKVDDGIKLLLSEPTANTTHRYDDPSYPKTGNVWGDLEVFNARDDMQDFVIHDKEQIIVQYDENDPNTLKIRSDAELTIEKGGRLVIEKGPDGETGDNINDGVIVLTDDTLTKAQIVDIIKDWGFTGTGIIKTPIGVFDNSGMMWGDIVDNSPTELQNKLTGGPQLVVIGKDDDDKSTLVAVDPTTSDDAYLVKPNKEIDLKLLVVDPANKKELSPSLDPVETPPGSGTYESHWMSTLIYPLKDNGTPWDLNEPGAPTPIMAPTTPVKIENSTANFQLSRDDVRDLREYAKSHGSDSFVIWVYETDGKLSTDPKAGGIKKPFVFRIDEPEHQFHDIVESDPAVKDRVVAGDNLLVFGMEPVAGGTDDPKFVSMNPTRQDPVYGVPHGTGLALDLYVAKNAKSSEIERNSPEYEGMYVKASIRPYDGLTPEEYRGLGDFIAALDRGPHQITNGFVDFDYTYAELHRWARLHRLNEFVVYVYDTDEHGNMKAEKIAREFVFRLTDADVAIHGQHCSGCDVSGGMLAGAAALAYIVSKRKRS